MTVKQEQAEIAGRARRIDWEVEVGSGSSEWAYRITCPGRRPRSVAPHTE
jgi:hypothetical protein